MANIKYYDSATRQWKYIGVTNLNYNKLANKPSNNNVILEGNKTSEDLGLATANDLPKVLHAMRTPLFILSEV